MALIKRKTVSQCITSDYCKGWNDAVNAQEKKEIENWEYCVDCKEYDREKHCCHRFTKCINCTAEELKEYYAEHEALLRKVGEILPTVCEELCQYPEWYHRMKDRYAVDPETAMHNETCIGCKIAYLKEKLRSNDL